MTAALGLQIVGAKTRYSQELASGGGESEAGEGQELVAWVGRGKREDHCGTVVAIEFMFIITKFTLEGS